MALVAYSKRARGTQRRLYCSWLLVASHRNSNQQMQDRNSLACETAKSRSSWLKPQLEQRSQTSSGLVLPVSVFCSAHLHAAIVLRLSLLSCQDAACSCRLTSHQVRKRTRKSMSFSSIDYSFCGNKQMRTEAVYSVCYSKRVRDLHLLLVETSSRAE